MDESGSLEVRTAELLKLPNRVREARFFSHLAIVVSQLNQMAAPKCCQLHLMNI